MTTLSDLPHDELLRYAQVLGLDVDAATDAKELVDLIRQRQDLLETLPRDTLLELIRWTRRAVRADATAEELAREIAASKKMAFDGLTQPALYALAQLRNIHASPQDPPETLVAALKAAEGWFDKFRRKRDKWVGGLLGRYLLGPETPPANQSEYKFLPGPGPSANNPSTILSEPAGERATLADDIADRGLLGGLTGRLRGVADDYMREKLDEIERRIDRKLDEIDRRLGEWRDRELENRLRIFKITLLASVVVAALSLLYNVIHRGMANLPDPPAATAPANEPSLPNASTSVDAKATTPPPVVPSSETAVGGPQTMP